MAPRASRKSLAIVSFVLLFEVFVIGFALSIPMRRGAALGEAIAVLPQAVLWVIPLALAFPVLVALAVRLGSRRSSRPDPEPDPFPTGQVTSLAGAIRTAQTVQFARYRVVERLVEIGTLIALSHGAEEPQPAWANLEEAIARREPDVVSFLRYKGLRQLTGETFVALTSRSIAMLETLEQED